MAYKPKHITVGTTAQQEIGPDPNRDTVVVTNLSTTTNLYWGVDSELSTANGGVIYPMGRIEFTWLNGRDPRIIRWLVAESGTIDVSIDEEGVGGGRLAALLGV